jgi:hypothetical protein
MSQGTEDVEQNTYVAGSNKFFSTSSAFLPSSAVFSGAMPVLFTSVTLHELENALCLDLLDS